MKNDPTSRQARRDNELLPALRETVRGAGGVIMALYNQAASNDNVLGMELKGDQSPVTLADKRASALIERNLRHLTPDIPVVCEENATDIDHEAITAYWAVDPLDGTKEFLKRTGGFAVKIALLRENVPVLGAVYSPVQDALYYTGAGLPAFKKTGSGPAIEMRSRPAQWQRGHLRTLFNQAHADPELYAAKRLELAARGLPVPESPHIVPGLQRNLQVAEGLADLHVVTGKDKTLRGSGGYVWDNAADWLLLRHAGGAMVNIHDGKPMRFGAVRDRMPGYIAFGDRSLGKKVFPELD